MCDIWIILIIGCFKTLWKCVLSDSMWSLQFYFMPYYTRTVKYTQSYVKIPDEYSYKHSRLCLKRMWTVGKEIGLGVKGSQQPNTVNLQLSVKQQKKRLDWITFAALEWFRVYLNHVKTMQCFSFTFDYSLSVLFLTWINISYRILNIAYLGIAYRIFLKVTP